MNQPPKKHWVIRQVSLLLSALVCAAVLSAAAPTNGPTVSYMPYEEARPILEAMREILPAELRAANAAALPIQWPLWVGRRNAEIRARLAQGDEDSLINFLLFGTSFTSKPRITIESLARAAADASQPDAGTVSKAMRDRAADLVQGMVSPGNNERLAFARRTVDSKGYEVKTAAGRDRVIEYLLAGLARVLNENSGYSKVLESARLLGDPSAEFAERSKLFGTRGLSSDTSLLPNFALEKALTSIKIQGLLKQAGVRRVAVIGPGLDFTDKEDGYDFYPQQTIQPFAIIDTLLRLALARAKEVSVTTFDLSPRVNSHLAAARSRAARGIGYVVQLPRRPNSRWRPETTEYWTRLGDQVGVPVTPVAVPAGAGDVKVRAVRIRPAIVSSVTPQDVNIVLQRLDLPAGDRFDLIIATNILVYYDVFEQSLALANIERMLKPGGLLLSNNALLELPGSKMHSIGYETVAYSDRPNDGDHIVWYQRSADK